MRIYPPYTKTRVKIANHDMFRNYLTQKIRPYGTGYGDDVLIGEIEGNQFRAQVERSYYNTGRPIISGKINDGELTVSIGINSIGLLIPVGMIALFLIMGIIKGSIFVIPVVLFVSTFVYLLFWMLYTVDLKATKQHLDEIIQKAQEGQTNITMKNQ